MRYQIWQFYEGEWVELYHECKPNYESALIKLFQSERPSGKYQIRVVVENPTVLEVEIK
jgi:hypothetical protein